jgi:hypothetical protein
VYNYEKLPIPLKLLHQELKGLVPLLRIGRTQITQVGTVGDNQVRRIPVLGTQTTKRFSNL